MPRHIHSSRDVFFGPVCTIIYRYGAYGPDMFYSKEDIEDIVAYATVHGVRVVPELDVPAHTWAGWEWGPDAGLGELVLCGSGWIRGRKVDWATKAMEPPAGQLNVVNEHVYHILSDLYEDLVEMFGGPDIMHLGGDEVCMRMHVCAWALVWVLVCARARSCLSLCVV